MVTSSLGLLHTQRPPTVHMRTHRPTHIYQCPPMGASAHVENSWFRHLHHRHQMPFTRQDKKIERKSVKMKSTFLLKSRVDHG